MKNKLNVFLIVTAQMLLINSFTYAADSFVANEQPPGYLHPMALSTFDLQNGGKGYRPWFENGAWQGDLIEYDIASTGAISTSIDLSTLEPSNSGTNWSARLVFNAAEQADANYWTNTRKIITHNGTKQVAFRWGSLTDAQQESLDKVNFDADAASSPILNFIRGERSNEKPAGTLRTRYNLLGDIMHSNPVYVGAPSDSSTQTSYIAFQKTHENRAPRVYVGANDGMLHVFDAATGEEVYAFIPPSVIKNLDKLTADPYQHTYFVDGELSVKDVYYSGTWRTVLTGSLGAGGSSRFALDITNPNLSSEGASSGTDNKILWIKDSTDDAALGDAYGLASTVKLPDNNYYSVVGNGYNSASGVAQLIISNIATGAITKITTTEGSVASPNGLSSPSLIDNNGDGKYDYAYAGDLNGNLWKFDLATKSIAYGKPIFTTANNQSITTKVSVTTHPNGGKLIYFGTGKILNNADLSDTTTQAIYGIWDKGTTPGTSSLLTQTLSVDKTVATHTVKTLTNTSINWVSHTGWKVDLTDGFRVVTDHQLRDGRIQTTITNPVTDENWLFEPNFLNGGAPYTTIYDLDGNGSLELADNIDGSKLRTDIPVAWKVSSGVMSRPLVARISNGIDTKFLNFEQLAVPEVGCTSGCGFLGGHIDVDTDANFGGATDKHTHEYDKKILEPYVDYFEVDDLITDQVAVDDAISVNQKFFVIIANADLSSKSELHIGNRVYNVLEYQTMIHKKLKAWDGDLNNLKDDDGNSLIITLQDIDNPNGTIRNSFDSHSILDGGLHPTQTGCVKSDPEETFSKGRWRNGSLVTQLIDPNLITRLDDLFQQIPTDLPDFKEVNGNKITLKDGTNIYGGLRAKTETGFLYESTLFWHYDDTIAKIKGYSGDTKVCYGESGYDEAVAVERNGLTELEYNKILSDNGYASVEELTAISEIFKAIEAQCPLKDDGKLDCKKLTGDLKDQYDDLKDEGKLAEELLSLAAYVLSGEGQPSESTSTVPLVIVGGNKGKGVTAGPNFVKGRRTWIDITGQ